MHSTLFLPDLLLLSYALRPDTDAAVIGCSLAAQIPAQVLLHTGTQERRRYISLPSVAARLGNGVCQALPGLHAFTGCDSTT